jgi:UDP-N-acetylmuramate--alanine ligase
MAVSVRRDARVHVVGVGGAGMSGVARLLVERGARVSGSDATDSATLEGLRAVGVDVYVGHDELHGADADVVLWSPAIALDNPELVAARERGALLMNRATLFGELGREQRVLGLTGTHGKTTATSMLVQVLRASGRDDGWLLGAEVLGVGANGHWGSGDLIVELDESYGTFADVSPYALGLLNVEPDHLDHYGSLDALESAFAQLVDRTSGPVVAWCDDEGARRVVDRAERDVIDVGSRDEVTWRVEDVRVRRDSSSFTLRGPNVDATLSLHVTGAHNVADAAVVAVLAIALGISVADVAAGLARFEGAPRRFQLLGPWKGVDLYESYAHLPGEITAIVDATHAAGYERILAVFQPHRVTRTLNLVPEFAAAFDGVATVIVTDIYRAGEENPTGVTGEVIDRAIGARAAGVRHVYCAHLNDVPDALEELRGDHDVVLLLGAGDVATIAPRLLDAT